MKKKVLTWTLCLLMVLASTQPSQAIVWVVVKAAVKKAIKAVDLAVQKQQNKVIWLQNAQKTLENTMAKLKLDEISDWTEKQKDQYKKYYDELRKVKVIITYYQRLRDLAQKQNQLLMEYQRAWNIIRNDPHFSAEEIADISKNYRAILNEAAQQVEGIVNIISSFHLEMSDSKRLEMINQTAEQLENNFRFLLRCKQENGMISYGRAKNQQDAAGIKQLYGLQTPNFKL